MKTDGQEIYQYLLRQGMIVRPMTAYKLPEWIRITIGRRSQNAQLIKLLKAYLSKKA